MKVTSVEHYSYLNSRDRQNQRTSTVRKGENFCTIPGYTKITAHTNGDHHLGSSFLIISPQSPLADLYYSVTAILILPAVNLVK